MSLAYRNCGLLTTFCVSYLVTLASCQMPPLPEDSDLKGTAFLDHETPISSYWGQTFLQQNIPFIDIPDTQIQDVYYYRWSTIQRHLRYTIAGTGYITTEFCQPVGYAQAFNTIDAAAGHQIDEARWLRSRFYNNDNIQAYTRGPANSTQYTQWISDAAWRRGQVVGDIPFVVDNLRDMVRLWHQWDFTFDSDVGLYYWTPDFDAQEYSLPGYVIAAQGFPTELYVGPNTYRPSHNAYMTANARAIANTANYSGDEAVFSQFDTIATNLETAMYTHLWDPVQKFFVDVIRENNPDLAPITGREEVGLFPFRFGIGLSAEYSVPTVASMFDSDAFLTEYGPPTLEVRNQYYAATKPDTYCCYWNGQSWPYSTAHTMKSLAAIYRSGTGGVTSDQYYQYLSKYAATQMKDGVPYVAESHYPQQDGWSADTTNHSEHYDHSTYNDDLITGLLGVVPQTGDYIEIAPIIPSNWTWWAIENVGYHGHLVTVLYDSDGTRYNQGSGLTIYIDGTSAYTSATFTTPSSVTIPIPAPPSSSGTTNINIAANPLGLGHYPTASATYTYTSDWVYKAIDGYLFYDSVPDNRWTNYQSPSASDTVTITFARPRTISSVTLALFSDRLRGGSVDVPASISIVGSSGDLGTYTNSSVADGFLANDRNTFSFNSTTTTFIAVTVTNAPPYFVGICELEIWVPFIDGPTYYAVDALLTNAVVGTNLASNATTTGSIVTGVSNSTLVAWSGITTSGAGTFKFTLTYSNPGTAVTVNIIVNQVKVATVSLVGTGGVFSTVSSSITMAKGKNFVSVSGGASGVEYETITIQVSLGSNYLCALHTCVLVANP